MELCYLEPEQLAELLLVESQKILIVDVRDDDYVIGRIRGSRHYPFCRLTTDHGLRQQLMREADGKEMVIFHCHFSQTRGPEAAEIFTREHSGQTRPLILRGGWKVWRERYRNDERFVELFK